MQKVDLCCHIACAQCVRILGQKDGRAMLRCTKMNSTAVAQTAITPVQVRISYEIVIALLPLTIQF